MEPIKPSKTMKVYQLVRQTGLSFSNAPSISTPVSLGCGFYPSLHEAEINRTNEVLKETATTKSRWHIFELEVPNPVHEE